MAIKIVNAGVDTLLVNVKLANDDETPNGETLPEHIAKRLDDWQARARKEHDAIATDLLFSYKVGDDLIQQTLMIRPHGSGVWSWLLYSDDIKLSLSYGSMNGGVFCQARLSSHLLWSIGPHSAIMALEACLYDFIGSMMHVQASELHLCCDITGWDVSRCNWQEGFVSRVVRIRARPDVPTEQEQEGGLSSTDVRKLETAIQHQLHGSDGEDEHEEVMMPYPTTTHRRISTLDFGSHGSAISCQIYNKSEEIKVHKKYWFYPIFQANGWDGKATVYRLEIRAKRRWLASYHLNEAFDVLSMLCQIWHYATTEWLRYVDLSASSDSNKSRLPTHEAWSVIQGAFVPLPDEQDTRDEEGERAARLSHLLDTKPLQVLEQAVALQVQAAQEGTPLLDDDPDGGKRQHALIEQVYAVRDSFMDAPLDAVQEVARQELNALTPSQVSDMVRLLSPTPFEQVQATLIRQRRMMAKQDACISMAIGCIRSAVALAGDELAGVRPGASVQEQQAVLPDWRSTLIWFLEKAQCDDTKRERSHREEVLKKRLSYGFVTAQQLMNERAYHGVDLQVDDWHTVDAHLEQLRCKPHNVYMNSEYGFHNA